MEIKKFSIAIIGCGSRGAEAYGRIMADQKDRFEIAALCDVNEAKLKKYGGIFGVKADALFSREEEFFAAKRADALVIATMDNDHVRQCEKALQLGYDVLLEKPVTGSEAECARLLAAHEKYGGKVVVCHVLRYAPAYVKLKEILDGKSCGELVMIDSVEQVCYWHQAHSFVRGNWRNSGESSPMILQKCCHDLDLLQYYAGGRCEALSSMGDLRHFRRECQPQGASDRCTDCKYVHTCTYSAENIYIGNWKSVGSPDNCWPYNVLTTELPLTEANIRKAIETGPYGRCVYACDNDVVDHQIVEMRFFNGIKANLRMTAFTAGGGRIMKFYCTEGQIDMDEGVNVISIKRFNRPVETIDVNVLLEGGHNHGGGDNGLIEEFYKVLCGEEDAPTRLEDSVESHLMAIRAEESRRKGGALLAVHAEKR
ncbi:MAG: Gfo/Idh/MocA family oxidoreductase [Firmicutes bacterium]|nr:Gfo/Idh/MocA family oxidoreductase [Bacillota bacterium]